MNAERRIAGTLLAGLQQDLVLAAIQEGIDPAVAFAGHAFDLARSGHAIDQLQGDALGALHRDRIAPELGDG